MGGGESRRDHVSKSRRGHKKEKSHKRKHSKERDERKRKRHRSPSKGDDGDNGGRKSKRVSKSKNEKSRSKSTKSEKRSRSNDSGEIEMSVEKQNSVLEEARKRMTALQNENKKMLEAVEEERRKRRERVKAWQEIFKSDEKNTTTNTDNNVGKEWNLEDEHEEEETNQIDNAESTKSPPNEECDDIDPLDQYMNTINEKIKIESKQAKISTIEEDEEKTQIIETIVPIDPVSARNDVEILEQFGDAAEYSSEEDIDEGPLTLPSKKNIKVLPTVDHNRIYYKNFRKNLYIEVPEISKLTEEEVTALRTELDNIQIKGKGCPKPIKKWVQAGLNPVILDVLRSLNYDKPTPIQAQALPAIMSGRDVIGIAKTGSGKTIAFLLPLLRHVLDQPPLNDGDGPIAIVMTPTRELAVQIWRECRKFTKYLNLKALCIYGGSVVSEQISELKRGTQIVICTPGRMIDMLTVNSGKITNLRRCTFFVLDEADRMFDLGFEPQVMKILEQIRPDRQTCLFTATFSTKMEALARRVLTKPIELICGSKNKVCEDVKQYLVVVEQDNKFLKLLELLGMYSEAGNILVFVDKQDSADELLRDLLMKGYPCRTLHGGMDQYDRDSTLSDFKAGLFTLLIATSVASRGIDCKNIVLVINYDCPNHSEDYVHRCGRTGRAGMKGSAITFISSKDGRHLKGILSVVENTDCETPQGVINLYKRHLEIEGTRGFRSSGFGGHGFKFNDVESLHSSDSKKMIKWSFGWQDSGDEAEAEDRILRKIEQEIDKSFSSCPRSGGRQNTATVDKDKIEKAQNIANKLNQRLKAMNALQPTADQQDQAQFDQIVKPITAPSQQVSQNKEKDKNLDMAKEIANKLNVKFDPQVMAPSKPNSTTTVKKLGSGEVFFEEIDINDFPQLARQRLISKECLDSIAHTSDCALTVRGSYCQPGKPMDYTERRLHLLIEGNTEFKVQICKSEIKRVLKEESVKSDYVFTQTSSRYRIV